MYWTPKGERVLRGAEGRLFRYGLELVVDELTEFPEEAESGIQSFDRMTIGQRLTGLHKVAAALLDESVPRLPLTQPIVASVGAVYRLLADYAVMEAESGDESFIYVRSLICEALDEAEMGDIPDPRCMDCSEWELCVECLRD